MPPQDRPQEIATSTGPQDWTSREAGQQNAPPRWQVVPRNDGVMERTTQVGQLNFHSYDYPNGQGGSNGSVLWGDANLGGKSTPVNYAVSDSQGKITEMGIRMDASKPQWITIKAKPGESLSATEVTAIRKAMETNPSHLDPSLIGPNLRAAYSNPVDAHEQTLTVVRAQDGTLVQKQRGGDLTWTDRSTGLNYRQNSDAGIKGGSDLITATRTMPDGTMRLESTESRRGRIAPNEAGARPGDKFQFGYDREGVLSHITETAADGRMHNYQRQQVNENGQLSTVWVDTADLRNGSPARVDLNPVQGADGSITLNDAHPPRMINGDTPKHATRQFFPDGSEVSRFQDGNVSRIYDIYSTDGKHKEIGWKHGRIEELNAHFFKDVADGRGGVVHQPYSMEYRLHDGPQQGQFAVWDVRETRNGVATGNNSHAIGVPKGLSNDRGDQDANGDFYWYGWPVGQQPQGQPGNFVFHRHLTPGGDGQVNQQANQQQYQQQQGQMQRRY